MGEDPHLLWGCGWMSGCPRPSCLASGSHCCWDTCHCWLGHASALHQGWRHCFLCYFLLSAPNSLGISFRWGRRKRYRSRQNLVLNPSQLGAWQLLGPQCTQSRLDITKFFLGYFKDKLFCMHIFFWPFSMFHLKVKRLERRRFPSLRLNVGLVECLKLYEPHLDVGIYVDGFLHVEMRIPIINFCGLKPSLI